MKRLYCIPNWKQIEEYVKFSKEYDAAFEYNDFYNPELLEHEKDVKRLICDYKGLGRDTSMDTLHGVFLDITISSSDKRIREASFYRVRQSMEIAQELGVKAVIFHTNFIPNFHAESYEQDWVYRNETYWRKILETYPGVEIYMENMFDETPRLLSFLAERMKDEPRFGVCFDIAHANLSGLAQDSWRQALAPYIRHLHINDNEGHEDSHKAVGEGSILWEDYQELIKETAHVPSVLIEVNGMEALKKSVSYMEKKEMYPFDVHMEGNLC